MKITSLLQRHFIVLGITIGITLPTFLFGYPSGITGRTLKSTLSGCGSCHSASSSSSVTVSINGPDNVIAGQSYTDTISVIGGSGTSGGIDIATFRGSLAVLSSTLKLSSGELTHKSKLTVPFTYLFTYTAPATAGTDTLYATGKGADFDSWNWAANKVLVVTLATGVADEKSDPLKFRLVQNYPNPFNPVTSIQYFIKKAASVTLKVYNISGKEITTLVSESQQPGDHTVEWNGENIPSGVYMYRLVAGNYTETRKMMLLR